MTTELPDPLVPAEVDLRDFAFMPLDVARLRDSALASEEVPEACWAAVLLWCASWHQVPAASVPDNDQWLAKVCGYVSRGKIDSAWKKVRAGALRGWVSCNDGRLYHPVVAEKAVEAWKSKLEQRYRAECGRVKKYNQRHKTALCVPDFDSWMSDGCPRTSLPFVPEDITGMSPGTKTSSPEDIPRDTASKGQGEGQGQGQGLSKPVVTSPTSPSEPIGSDGKPSNGGGQKLTDPDEIIFGYGVPLLVQAGSTDKHARSFLGGLRKHHGDIALIDKLRECLREKPLQPLEWLAAALPPTGKARGPKAENFAATDYGAGGRL